MAECEADLRGFCVEEYPRLVIALRVTCGRDEGLAEDLAQEALTRLCQHWSRVSDGPSPRGWLYQVAFNLARSHWRRQAVRRRVEARLRSDYAVAAQTESVADHEEIHRALRRLSVRERTVVALRYFLDLDVEQTASVLDTSPQAVRSLCHRAVAKLRSGLTDLAEAEPIQQRRTSKEAHHESHRS